MHPRNLIIAISLALPAAAAVASPIKDGILKCESFAADVQTTLRVHAVPTASGGEQMIVELLERDGLGFLDDLRTSAEDFPRLSKFLGQNQAIVSFGIANSDRKCARSAGDLLTLNCTNAFNFNDGAIPYFELIDTSTQTHTRLMPVGFRAFAFALSYVEETSPSLTHPDRVDAYYDFKFFTQILASFDDGERSYAFGETERRFDASECEFTPNR